jgi:polysaccharide biosynthesis transport protein
LLPELRTCVEAPLRRPFLVIVPAALAAIGGMAAAVLLPQTFRASTLVKGSWEVAPANVGEGLGTELAARRFQAVKRQILEPSSVEQVLLDVRPFGRDSRGSAPSSQQVQGLRASVSVDTRGGNVFAIQCSHADPRMAALICNRLATLLIERAESERTKSERSSPTAIGRRLAEAERVMEDAEVALRRLQQGSSPSQADPLGGAARHGPLAAEEDAIAASLAKARAREADLRRAIEASGGGRTSAAPDPSPELASLRAELTALRMRYTEEHPDVQALKRQILRAEAARPSSPVTEQTTLPQEAELGRVVVEIADLQERQARLDAEKGVATGGSRNVRTPGNELQRLTDEHSEARAAYLKLLEEWRSADTAWRLGRGVGPTFELQGAAQVPTRPYSPNRVLFALAGLAAGLMLGLVAALVAEVRDRSVKGPEDLAKILLQPLLAEIPFVRDRHQGR